ncbi:MAG: tRNA pseudouridine(38-40) synthase TruA [Candidatus Omnitrophica bacterium]|nr:tRNA pseudouridine(38-40) synthase TruA [Candidatus Omnitrophota bacterium]
MKSVVLASGDLAGRPKRNLKLQIEYDGSQYSGWQIQNHQRSPEARRRTKKTIQQVLEKTLQEILQQKIKVIVSGRTDAGVHALAQVVNFYTISKIPLERLQLAVNSLLPHDIVVTKIEDVPESFHSRFSAKSKIYRYIILNRKYSSALLKNTVFFFPHTLNVGLMQKEARVLLGRHDFKCFQTSEKKEKNTVRIIKKISIRKNKDFINIEIEANGFLYNMVRNIVGTLIEIGRGKLPPNSMKKILVSKNRIYAGPIVPSQGLCLIKVKY